MSVPDSSVQVRSGQCRLGHVDQVTLAPVRAGQDRLDRSVHVKST